MADPTLADQAHHSALQMWESAIGRGPRPTRDQFNHLNTRPEHVTPPAIADPPPRAAPTSTDPLDPKDADTVKALLDDMRSQLGLRPEDGAR